MKLIAAIVLALIVIGLYLKSKSSDNKPKKPAKIGRRTSKPSPSADSLEKSYPGVAIKLCANACKAAEKLENIRYLSGEAPLLPLPGCDKLKCACKYVHYDDRRDINEDRRHAYSMKTDLYTSNGNENRRQEKERRNEWSNFSDFDD